MGLALVKPTIEELRQLIGSGTSSDRERSSFSLYPRGLALGSITEICGHGKTQAISLFLKEHSDFKTVWIEEKITINPYALFQMGVNLENILFIEAKNEMNWCLDQALQSGCFKVLVTQTQKMSEKQLRRYQLISEKNQSHFFLLTESPQQSWVPQLQLKVQKNKSNIELDVIKKRGLG